MDTQISKVRPEGQMRTFLWSHKKGFTVYNNSNHTKGFRHLCKQAPSPTVRETSCQGLPPWWGYTSQSYLKMTVTPTTIFNLHYILVMNWSVWYGHKSDHGSIAIWSTCQSCIIWLQFCSSCQPAWEWPIQRERMLSSGVRGTMWLLRIDLSQMLKDEFEG